MVDKVCSFFGAILMSKSMVKKNCDDEFKDY